MLAERGAPRLVEIDRRMVLSTGTQKGSAAVVSFGPSPLARMAGTGSVRVVVTGNIVDSSGLVMGDLNGFLDRAITAWEALVRDYGARPTSA